MSGIWPKARAVARTAGIIAFAAPLLAAQALVAGPLFNDYDTIPRRLKGGLLKIMGIRTTFNQAASAADKRPKPAIYAPNHMSYLDIIVLGAHIPGAFVAKSEVRGWPVVGFAASRVKTIFTERRIGTLRRDQRKIVKTLNGGRDVILFPEGTTSPGGGVLPFKAGLLCVSFNNVSRVDLEQDIQVRPTSMKVTHVNGKDAAERADLQRIYAWVGGENIARHFWRLAQIDSMDIEITAHPAMDPAEYPDRRAFTKAVEEQVRCGL